MICPKCGSNNTNVQIINEITLKKKKNWLYWVTCMWALDMILWVLFFLQRLILAIIFKIFKGNNYKVKNKQVKILVCNDCGYSKKIK